MTYVQLRGRLMVRRVVRRVAVVVAVVVAGCAAVVVGGVAGVAVAYAGIVWPVSTAVGAIAVWGAIVWHSR